MGKNDSQKTGLGRALVKHHNKMVQQTKDKNRFYKKKFLESFTEVSDIEAILEQSEELLEQELEEPTFLPDRTAAPALVINLDPGSGSGDMLTPEEMREQQKREEALHASSLRVPRRPPWSADMSVEELDANERQAFLAWRRNLARLEENKKLILTPFEKNLDIWRQLWRVVERSDLLVMVVDSRDPLFYRCLIHKHLTPLSLFLSLSLWKLRYSSCNLQLKSVSAVLSLSLSLSLSLKPCMHCCVYGRSLKRRRFDSVVGVDGVRFTVKSCGDSGDE